VEALRVALASGEVVELRRSRLEKNTVGYALAHDPVDWFVGSEGTLGVIVEAELSLLPLPSRVLGLGIPFARENDALDFIIAARASRVIAPRCLEFFDSRALGVVREAQRREGLTEWAPLADALVYAEESGADQAEPPLDEWLALAERHEATADDLMVFDGDAAIRDARRARHSVPATMIERGNANRPAGGRRVSTDWAVPYRRLKEAVVEARRLASEGGIAPPVIYGHAGNGHPHQNFIAHDAAELSRIERVVEATLRHVIALGGTVAAEHGIGKLKRKWVSLQLSPMQLGVMRAVKGQLDPHGLLAPGNIFP
jgi:FAD/FMN-containing dehydrogenase